MISYVDCLSGESSVPDLTPRCFSPVPEPDDAVRLLPRKPSPVQARAVPIQARSEGSLRRRLLSARVHHHYAALKSHAPPPPSHNTAWGLGQEVKGDTNPEGQHKSVFGANRRTSYINPEPRPGYVRTQPLQSTAMPPLKYQDVDVLQAPPPQFKYKPKKRRGWFRRKRKHQDASPSTPLLFHARDPDRKWSVRYTTQKPLHGLLFLPSTTRGNEEPSSPEPVPSLNQQNGPAPFSSDPRIHQSENSRGFEWQRRSRKMSSVDSDDDERLVVSRTRPMTPLVLKSCWEGPASCVEAETSCGLPTPEEVTRRHALTIMADIVPINITGESFDRQASVHRSLSQRDALSRRPSLNRTTSPGLDRGHSQDQVGPDLVQSSAHIPSRTPDQDRDLSQDQRNWTEPSRLMNTLTSSKRLEPQEVPPSTSCLQTPDSATYRAIYYSPADAQSDCQSLCSSVLEPWTYQALSPSTSLHSAQDSGSVSGECWSCEPLLCSGSPSHQSLRSESSSVYSNLQNCSQTSFDLEENSLCFGQISEKNAPSSSLNFHQNSSPSYDTLRSESTSNMSQMSLNLEEKYSNSSQNLNQNTDKMAVSSSFQTSPSYSSLRSESPSNLSLNLDRICSHSQTSLSSSGQGNSAKRLSVSSGSSLSRSISLKKSKRPPAPPLRNESLKRRPKPPRPSLEKRRAEERRSAEGSTPSLENERGASPIPALFEDPWVPRMKKRQSGLNCGTTTTFGPKEEEQNTTTTQAFCELQRLASPSSGYSSQSNTPLSSPVSPVSPPQKSPLQDLSVSRPKSRPRSGLKPRPPERTTSLLSSLSSSSSLSSCASETSIKNMPLPPPPPPLPEFNHQLPVSSYRICAASSIAPSPAPNPVILSQSHLPPSPPSPPPLPPSFSLPPPPPLPDFNQKRPACSYQIHIAPLNAANLHFSSTPEYFTVPPLSLPSPLLLPPRSSLPPPPPLPPSPQRLPVTRTIPDTPQNLPQNRNKATNDSSPPSPPPLPSQLSKPLPPPYPQSFNKSKMSPKTSPPKVFAPSSPLVTTQALKNVKLRSIRSQEFTRTNSLPTMDTTKCENTNTNLELLRKKANSATAINETPGLQDTIKECKSQDSRDGNLSQEPTFSEKDQQEGSNPTKIISKADLESSDQSKMHFSPNKASDEYPNCENINLSDGLTSADSILQQCDEKFEEDSKILLFIPDVTEEKCGLELSEESKVCVGQNEKSDDVYDGANSEGTVISNTCMQQNGKNEEAMNGTKSDVSNLKECLKATEIHQEISLDEIETVLRDLDASMEESEREMICQSRDIDSTTSRDILDAAQECNVTEMGQSLGWSDLKSRDSDVFIQTDQSVGNSPAINEVLLKEKHHKMTAAEICSTNLKIQNVQITNVKQYKLQTTENYFKTQNEQNLQNFTDGLEDFSKNSVFKERNQAYLDMYAMLAESTATSLNKEEDLDGNLNSGGKNVQKKRKKSKSKAKYSYYDVNKRDASEFSDTGLNGQDTFEERNLNALKLDSVSDGPWVKMQTSPEDVEVSKAEESQYWSLCQGDAKEQLQKGEKVEEKEQSLSPKKDQLSPTKTRSPIKPTLPKKPDLGIHGLLNRTARKDDSVEKTGPENAQYVSPNQNSNSPQREKPPILHKKPDLATLTQTSPKTIAKTSTKTPELVWRDMEDSTEVWTVRKLENDSTISKITTLDNFNSSIEMSSHFSTESCKTQTTDTNAADFEAILERSATGFSGLMQNCSTNFSRKSKEHCAPDETLRNTFVDTTTTPMPSRVCTLENGKVWGTLEVWSPGHFERFDGNNDVVWECMEANVQENIGRILRFENDQNSWMENLENLGSYKNRTTNVPNSSEKLWCPRNAQEMPKSECGFMEHDRSLTGFCAIENYKKKNNGCSSGVQSEQEEVFGIDGQQNVKIQSQIWQRDCDFVTDFQRGEFVAEECAVARTPMKKTQQKKQNQKLFMQKEKERFSFSSSSSSSSLSSSESETETRLNTETLEESRRMIGQSCLSLSSALSTDSLKGELSLPDLLIQEPEEEEHDVFGGVSADQVTVPAQTRSTDDLFAIIHRSKRKMFGRKDSGVFSASSFSSSSLSPPVTPTDLCPVPRGQRSQQSHSFKALLLKKGVHFGSVSRISAVERLCRPSRLQGSTSCPTQRPLTPPCSASRWFSPRTRLHTPPMAVILEYHEEEDQQEGDDEVFEPNEVLF